MSISADLFKVLVKILAGKCKVLGGSPAPRNFTEVVHWKPKATRTLRAGNTPSIALMSPFCEVRDTEHVRE